MSVKKMFGWMIKGLIGAVVMVYLGLHTINFFMYTFPPEQWYLSWLGFGLTGGGLVGYLIVFLWDADSKLRKVIALIMMFVCGIGEVLAAGFGMEIEAWSKAGFALTESDFNMMLMAVRALAFLHFLALILYVAGDKVAELFSDADGDGIPNLFDKDYKPAKKAQKPQEQKPNQNQPTRVYTVPELLTALKMDRAQFNSFLVETDTLGKAWQVLRDDGLLPKDITHRNFNELAGQVNPTMGERR